MTDPILKLRRNEGFSVPQAAPDHGVLAAFSRGGARDPSAALDDMGLVTPRASCAQKSRLSVVFTARDFPIPLPLGRAELSRLVAPPRRGAPASIPWRSSTSAPAHLVTELEDHCFVRPAQSRTSGQPIRRALAIAAVAVPMGLSASPASAFAPPSTVPEPASAPGETGGPTVPKLPEQPNAAAPMDPTATTEGAGTARTVAPVTTTTTTAPSVSTTAPVSSEPFWDALRGEQVVLTRSEGAPVRAKFLGHQGPNLILAREGDGLVYTFPKLGITAVNVVPQGPARRSKPLTLMPKDGTGLLVGGSLLTLAGAPLFITGLAFSGYSPGYSMIYVLPGAAGLAGGITMLVIGAKRKRKYRQWMFEHAMSATALPTRKGWTGSLSLRF